ncbi:MAG: GIY-YIG nuclease family protein [Ignavibacterium sp.]|nr:GIY-YIG nuclease family protein [Ignavibacterium sp.]
MGKKLTVYLIDGREFGPKIIEIGNWVGKAIYSPRASVNNIMKRYEVNNPGVYLLKSNPLSETYSERIYIGEAENIGKRIKQHLGDTARDFYEIAFFISKDELLTKSQIKYLEARLISLAIEAKTAEIENGNAPNLPTLHEADVSDMEYFLEQIKLVLPLLSFNFLKSTTVRENQYTEIQNKKSNIFRLKNKRFKAKMVVTDDGFIVERNSQANKSVTASMTSNYKKLRQKLIETGVLVDKGNNYIFSEDTIFSSPSAASNIVLGRQSAGPLEWINSQNKSYKDLIESS